MDSLRLFRNSIVDEISSQTDGIMEADTSVYQNPDREDSSAVSIIEIMTVLPSTRDEIMYLGYPSDENIYEEFSYIFSYNQHNGVPNWTSECLTYDQEFKSASKDNYISRRNYVDAFYEDTRIEPDRRVTLNDYSGSGYCKGHLAAARNHSYNIQAYESTFCLSNIGPVYFDANHIWNRIENQGRSFARDYKKVYITTGPIYYQERERTFLNGGNKVAVPNAYFKVFAHRFRKKYKTWSYLVPNLPKLTYKNIKDARVSLDRINRATGLNLLNKLDKSEIVEEYDSNLTTSRSRGSH